jgi:hypothetical protein
MQEAVILASVAYRPRSRAMMLLGETKSKGWVSILSHQEKRDLWGEHPQRSHRDQMAHLRPRMKGQGEKTVCRSSPNRTEEKRKNSSLKNMGPSIQVLGGTPHGRPFLTHVGILLLSFGGKIVRAQEQGPQSSTGNPPSLSLPSLP